MREISRTLGYGVGDDMDYLLGKYVKHPPLDGHEVGARRRHSFIAHSYRKLTTDQRKFSFS
jgi:hypothetical protein